MEPKEVVQSTVSRRPWRGCPLSGEPEAGVHIMPCMLPEYGYAWRVTACAPAPNPPANHSRVPSFSLPL
eukprot:4040745-Pyramimonas_sp.AAC.1